MTVDYRIGDTRDVIANIPDDSISLVASSPPFIALRSYLPADHPDKHREIGSEPDPATFIDTLLALTADWGRVLAPWGSIAIELGDTFAGSSALGGDSKPDGEWTKYKRGALADAPPVRGGAWPRAKCLALVPQAYALSLAYGRNVLSGQPSPAGQWLVRNVITWHRPNPAVGTLGDKYRPSTSQIVVATRSAKRWFDLTAVRDSTSNTTRLVGGYAMVSGEPCHDVPARSLNPAGAPPLDAWFDEYDGTTDTWTLTTQPSKLAHYAMWPAKLAERLILSMCPAEVCTQCGEPRRRIENVIRLSDDGNACPWDEQCKTGEPWTSGLATTHQTTGWTDCGCGAPWTPGTVLDPFAGTGTSLAVADLHGRNAIGVDIDARNPELYEARRAECSRNLFGTKPELPGQTDLFEAAL